MPTCVPIKDMRDTVKFDELVATSPTPIIVTKNGYDRFVCIRSEDYKDIQRMRDEAAAEKLRARMHIMEYEREHGLARDASEVLDEIAEKYGLQN